jgi:thymidine kinase
MGYLEVIIGCMFASKTSELVRRYNKYTSINKQVLVINHAKDTRYSRNVICTHDQVKIQAHQVDKLMPLIDTSEFVNCDVILIEESQLFDDIVEFVEASIDIYNKTVIACGLSGTYEKKPFGKMLELIPHAEKITQLTAFCKVCGDGTLAHFSKCIVPTEETVLIGSYESYIPVCRKHF